MFESAVTFSRRSYRFESFAGISFLAQWLLHVDMQSWYHPAPVGLRSQAIFASISRSQDPIQTPKDILQSCRLHAEDILMAFRGHAVDI